MRIVVKVGTSTLAHSTGRLNIRHTEELVKVLSDLKNAGHEVILVSSGAIGMGVGKLSLSARPTDMSSKQACAAVGQCELMYTSPVCWNWAHCPSSTRTIPSPPTRSPPSATMTPSPPSSPAASKLICWCC